MGSVFLNEPNRAGGMPAKFGSVVQYILQLVLNGLKIGISIYERRLGVIKSV